MDRPVLGARSGQRPGRDAGLGEGRKALMLLRRPDCADVEAVAAGAAELEGVVAPAKQRAVDDAARTERHPSKRAKRSLFASPPEPVIVPELKTLPLALKPLSRKTMPIVPDRSRNW